MREEYKNFKTYQRLLQMVGKKVEVVYVNGTILEGILDCFDYSKGILSIQTLDSIYIINFRYVQNLKEKENERGLQRNTQFIEGRNK